MKVLLIHTDARMTLQKCQPLGIMYLAAYIRRELNADVKIIDLAIERYRPREIAAMARSQNFQAVGISALIGDGRQALNLSRAIKAESHTTPIIMGGPFAASYKREFLEFDSIDVIVCSEGEQTFAKLLPVLVEGDKAALHNVRGIAFKDGGEFVQTKERPFISDLDTLPFPAWDLIPVEKYSRYVNYGHPPRAGNYMSMFTSRACPYNCIYCHRFFGSKFRARSAGNVLAEMEELYFGYGVREFHILDDGFNIDIKRAKKICRGIIDGKMQPYLCLHNGVRTDLLDEELIDLLMEAGMIRISFAVEAASERMQKLIKKNLDLEKTRAMIEYTARKKVITNCYFMMGFPNETEEEIIETIDFAMSLPSTTADFFRPIPFKGSEMAKMVKESNLPGPLDDFRVSYDSTDINLSEVSDERLQYLHKQAFLRFHFTPARTFRFLSLYLPFYRLRMLRFFSTFIRRRFYQEKARIGNALRKRFDDDLEAM